MNDYNQLRILRTVLAMSVQKHGGDKVLTLGHLLNICKLAEKFEVKLQERDEQEHQELLNDLDPLGQEGLV